MYRLPFELTDSAELLHFTILGGYADPLDPLNDATGTVTVKKAKAARTRLPSVGFRS